MIDSVVFHATNHRIKGMTVDEPFISAIVITKNEAANIEDCLKSVSWADEIVVLDSGSTDKTVEIAGRYTANVYCEAWRGMGGQKNRAIELAKGPWIFSLDADERAAPGVGDEIRHRIACGPSACYALRRKNYYKSQWIRHCGWWPDWVTRVFRKGDAQFSDEAIHASLQTGSPICKLSGQIVHYSFTSPEDFLNRALSYAHHQAREMHCAGRKATVWTAVSHAGFALFHTYLTRLGFLDGAAGVLIAVSNGVGVFYRYMMLRDLNLSNSNESTALQK
jgi:glycosyltransferase involved in cell wall biosynthesis